MKYILRVSVVCNYRMDQEIARNMNGGEVLGEFEIEEHANDLPRTGDIVPIDEFRPALLEVVRVSWMQDNKNKKVRFRVPQITTKPITYDLRDIFGEHTTISPKLRLQQADNFMNRIEKSFIDSGFKCIMSGRIPIL